MKDFASKAWARPTTSHSHSLHRMIEAVPDRSSEIASENLSVINYRLTSFENNALVGQRLYYQGPPSQRPYLNHCVALADDPQNWQNLRPILVGRRARFEKHFFHGFQDDDPIKSGSRPQHFSAGQGRFCVLIICVKGAFGHS